MAVRSEDIINGILSLKLEIYVIEDIDRTKVPPVLKVRKDISNDSSYEDLTAPYNNGLGGSGTFYVPRIGTRVLCGRVKDSNEQFWAICYLPSVGSAENRSSDPARDAHYDSYPYPILEEGNLLIQNDTGHRLALSPDGIDLFANFNRGMRMLVNRLYTDFFSSFNTSMTHTDGTNILSGKVKRKKKGDFGPSVIDKQTPEGNNPAHLKNPERGIFTESKVRKIPINGTLKNFARTEFRADIRQYDKEFLGFSEALKEDSKREKSEMSDSDDSYKSLTEDMNNILSLNPSQLIEIVAGNVVDSEGNPLDTNFNALKFGKVPKDNKGIAYTTTARIESRALGLSFQLDGNNESDVYSNNIDNFVLTLDKSGFLNLNVPRNKDTDSIIRKNKVKFQNGRNGRIFSNNIDYELEEDIPIINYYSSNDGTLFAHPKDESLPGENKKRFTGILHEDIDIFNADSNDQRSQRIHPTKYHNMPAACEMIYGNYIKTIYVPETLDGKTKSDDDTFEYIDSSFDPDLYKDGLPTRMVRVGVVQENPAINPGRPFEAGDRNNSYCGKSETSYADGPLTNNFVVEKGEKGDKEAFKNKFKDDTIRTGGKSASLNFEGSIECSVGRDNTDKKSLLLDTEGSIVAWIGSDKAGGRIEEGADSGGSTGSTGEARSASIQTDGSVALSVGNMRKGLKGRLDIRVNVVDRGTASSQKETSETDYIISISENGLVISGGTNKPLLLRNKGDVVIESSDGQVKLSSGSGVQYKTGNEPYKDVGSSKYSKN